MNTNTSTTSGRTKAPKKRNSDVRKEQNRIASRAYREKRKQKLALLDEILKSDSQTDSMSSVSDETEGYTTSWSLQSRQASNSPIPAALSTVPVASPWPVVSPPMSSAVPSYGHDTYDGWMNSFDHSSHNFPTSNDYVQSYLATEVGDHSLDASASYNMQSMPSVTSTPSTPPIPSIPMDPMLVSQFAQHRHPQSAQNQGMANLSNPVGGGDDEISRQLWVGSLEDNALTALERFGGYSHVQQQQVLAWVRKRRNLSQNASSHQGLEYRYPTCQATPPPSAQFVNSDFRKYQSMRHASGSPIPHGHH
ncbi:hypothetical protein F4805DRAFT_264585 [Annulohypoxylon moriforme]|nr:hypothetical protein F4805DRAFT_264585 [Annulohypoxylon moriforme]